MQVSKRIKKLDKKTPFKTAIMGGSFNPFHLAHLNSLLTVREQFEMDQVLLLPSFKTPLKSQEEELEPHHRLDMLIKAVKKYPFIKVDRQEIDRKGLSYTYKSIQELSKKRKTNEELFFIMGLDQFYSFDQWKNYQKILEKAHLIVTSRPGFSFPESPSDLPKGLKPLIKIQRPLGLELSLLPFKNSKPGHPSKIYFCSLKDMDISSFYIRSQIQQNKEMSHLLPSEVDQYIQSHQIYKKENLIDKESRELIDLAVKVLKQKKAYEVKTYDLRSKPLPFSFAVIAICNNVRQTKALADHLQKNIRRSLKLSPLNEEGRDLSRWVVLDYGECLFHVFDDYTSRFYKLEELWKSCLMKEE